MRRAGRSCWFEVMKSTERHRLKENESVHGRPPDGDYDAYKHQITLGLVALVVIIAAVVAFVMWRGQTRQPGRRDAGRRDGGRAGAGGPGARPAAAPGATTPAPPPAPPAAIRPRRPRNEAALAKFMAVADAYPSSDAGIAARYHAAAMLMALGRHPEAQQRYQEVVGPGREVVYGDMGSWARRMRKSPRGGSTPRSPSQATVGRQGRPAAGGRDPDAAWTRLRRGRQAGDARQAFKRIVDEFPQSPMRPKRSGLEQIKG